MGTFARSGAHFLTHFLCYGRHSLLSFTSDPQKHLESLTHEWLLRAHPCPLDVSIHGYNESSIIKNAILPFSGRLKRLNIYVESTKLQLLFNHSAGLPLLEDLDLWEFYDVLEGEPLSFLNMPRLRRVILQSGIYLQQSIAIFPWWQLTEVSLKFEVEAATVVTLLFLMPDLQILCVDDIIFTTPSNSHCVHLTLSTLKIPSYYHSDPSEPSVSVLLQCLTLPALCHLSVGGFELSSLMDLQQRSSFSLKTLGLGDLAGASPDLLVSFLCRFPDLTELRFWGVRLDKPFIAAFHYHPLRNNFARCLKLLSISSPGDLLNYQDIIDMVRTRWWSHQHQDSEVARSGVARLKILCLRLSEIPNPEEAQQIAEFEKEGLELW